MVSLLCAPLWTQATDYTWIGAGINEVTSNSQNWLDDSIPPVGAQGVNLFFGKADQYVVDNDITNLRFYLLFFEGDAEQAYTLSSLGNEIHVQSDSSSRVINYSELTHTLEADLRFLPAASTFYTAAGDLIWSGSSSRAQGSYILNKTGRKALILRGGDHTTSISSLAIFLGEMVLDFDSALSMAAVDVTFGSAATTYQNAHLGITGGGGILRIIGSSEEERTIQLGNVSVSAGPSLGTGNASGNAARLIVDATGKEKTTVALGTLNGNTSGGSLNIRLLGDASVTATSVTNITNGIQRYTTVTQGGKTGFATTNPIMDGEEIVGYEIVRNVPTVELPGNNTHSQSVNYKLSGSINLTFQQGRSNSVTIQGAGTMTANTTGTNFGPWALLIEEGVGDYHINNVRYMGDDQQTIIHHYSTEGTLYLNGGVGRATWVNNSRLYTTGPGTIVVTDIWGESNGLSKLGIGGNHIVHHGSFGTIDGIHVESGGRLSGSGVIGGLVYTGETVRYSNVWVSDNSVLDGTPVAYVHPVDVGFELDFPTIPQALDITGQLVLNTGSTYFVQLNGGEYKPLNIQNAEGNTSAILTIRGGLELELNYAPKLFEEIILLTWKNGVRDGEFLSINSEAFGGELGNELSLLYNSQWYQFLIHYDYDLGNGVSAIVLHAIPEPSTVALLSGLVLMAGVAWIRRRRG
jgi:hypothetical protein